MTAVILNCQYPAAASSTSGLSFNKCVDMGCLRMASSKEAEMPAIKEVTRDKRIRAVTASHCRTPTAFPTLALIPSTKKLNRRVATPTVTPTAAKAAREESPRYRPRRMACTRDVVGDATEMGGGGGEVSILSDYNCFG